VEQNEDGFLKALAERPDDRALRLVFCDWLLEHSDPRGEAMALFEKGALSAAERRQLEKLQLRNGRKWLGPLGDAVVLEDCRFAGGLLHSVKFPANLPTARYAALTGEPRLATVRSITLEAGRATTEVGGFLAHPVLAQVVELAADVPTLLQAQGFSFSPQVLRLALWDPRADLTVLAGCAALRGATVLRLATLEFIVPAFAEELADALVVSGALEGRKRLELHARHATIEGVMQWLRAGAQRVRGALKGTIERWAVDYAETQLALEGADFEDFTIDAIATDARDSLKTRLATAGTVLGLLDGIGIRRVDVRQIPGGRLTRDELNQLRTCLRRLKSLEEFRVGGVLQSP